MVRLPPGLFKAVKNLYSASLRGFAGGSSLWLSAVFLAGTPLAGAAGVNAAGKKLYEQKCAMCHQATGLGVATVFPPLAKSNWLMEDRARTIRVLCEGLSGPITVNGQRYDNIMPAQMLDDQEVADVLTYVTGAWGNAGWKPLTREEVTAARSQSAYRTYARLTEGSAYRPLPQPPKGWTLKEVARLPEFCTRMAGTADGRELYVLAQTGSVYRLDRASGSVSLIINASEYLDASRGKITCTGLALDPEGRLLIVSNQLNENAKEFAQNEVNIFRTTRVANSNPAGPQPWFSCSYPHGVGPYNHGVGHIAFGPDGLLYVNSGARTDGGEPGNSPRFFQGGEIDLTACMWVLDPKAAKPEVTIFARGLRNVYGFAWDPAGRLFTVSNGPDSHAPEEMDVVERGKHYGFPYQFSNWPAGPGNPYPYTPQPPSGMKFTLPVVNLGPAGGGSSSQPLSTFQPHSSPAGMIWCGDSYPAPLRGCFLVARFGNFLRCPDGPSTTGFDLLSVRPTQAPDGNWQACIETVLAPLGRPIDVRAIGRGRILILEYTRITNNDSKAGMLPGRIVEFAPE